MTICVGVKVRDCLVFAADSAVSMMSDSPSGPVVTNIWNHGIKVYQLHKRHPIVAMSAGAGNLGQASVSDLAKYARSFLSNKNGGIAGKYTREDVAKKTADFFGRFVTGHESIDFWLGGYGSGDAFSQIWVFSFTGGTLKGPTLYVDHHTHNYVFWGGTSTAVQRLILGVDANVRLVLEQAGVADTIITDMEQRVSTPLVDAAMPVQDAIDLADFLVDTAKRYSAFLPGANVVGGQTDIATVTRHEGFKWIRRTNYYDAQLNRKDADHA